MYNLKRLFLGVSEADLAAQEALAKKEAYEAGVKLGEITLFHIRGLKITSKITPEFMAKVSQDTVRASAQNSDDQFMKGYLSKLEKLVYSDNSPFGQAQVQITYDDPCPLYPMPLDR